MTVGLGGVAEETCTSGRGQAPDAVCEGEGEGDASRDMDPRDPQSGGLRS